MNEADAQSMELARAFITAAITCNLMECDDPSDLYSVREFAYDAAIRTYNKDATLLDYSTAIASYAAVLASWYGKLEGISPLEAWQLFLETEWREADR